VSEILLTQMQYAKHRGVTQPAVSAWIKSGKLAAALVPGKRKNQYKINRDIADTILDQVTPYGEAKARREHFLALQAELDYHERLDELIDAFQAEKEAARVAKLVRDEIFKLPGKLSKVLVAESDSNKCYWILYDELEDTLRQLGQEII
jgi:predicted transcriptional regulator